MGYWLTNRGPYDASFEFPLPDRYAGLSLENFHCYLPSLEQKLDHISRWVQGKCETGLFLCGGVGTGKSHLAAAIYRELALQQEAPAFIRTQEFLSAYYEAFKNSSSPPDLLKRLVRHKFLFLDDLGSEKSTDFKRERIFDLIDTAYTHRRTLIITSNAKLSALVQLDERIPSRLAEMCDLIEFSEPDYRVRLAQGRLNRIVTAPPNLESVRTLNETRET